MLDFDSLREIGSTIKKNKLRTFLTGFSIAWGIFILIALLGAGNGLKNGITSNFSRRAKNAVSVWPGSTSKPFEGLPLDRVVKFDDKDLDMLRYKIPGVDHVSGQIYHSSILSNGNNYGTWNMLGVHPDASYINSIDMSTGKGRFINDLDIVKRRKVIVINTEIADILFLNTDPLGKFVIAKEVSYMVIGVYKDNTGRTNIPSYIPFSTAQSIYSKNYGTDRLDFTIKGLTTVEQNEAFIKELRAKLGALHHFDPEDEAAISIWNTAEDVAQTENILNGITFVIWIIGICSLISGIVGIGNIMLITVRERTKEFGIRKAIGASPISVLNLVLLESIVITTIFGYVGMMFGIGLMELINHGMESAASAASDTGPTVFKNPSVDLGIVMISTGILIVAGVIAGSIPAIKAIRISPIEAMRAE